MEHSATLARQQVNNAAALILDNSTLEVLAYVGNSAAPAPGHAVDIIRRPRSTGSILKPLLYAAMLDDGSLTPRMLLPDVPTHYEGFSPENFDRQYRGAVPADEALAHSLNVPAVRMLKKYGVARFADLLRGAGMSTLTRPADDYGLTLILGGAEGNLWDITALYAGLANIAATGSAQHVPQFRKPSVMLTGAPGPAPRDSAISIGAAWLTLDALLEVQRPGEEGHWKKFAGSRAIAWKTGTSFGLRDGWAVGTTSRHTVGVWVGNASGEGRPGLTGSGMAAPLMFELFGDLPASGWIDMPMQALRRIELCANDGYLPFHDCETTSGWVPKDSHFDALSPHNLSLHLDLRGAARVHSDCESPGRNVAGQLVRVAARAGVLLPARARRVSTPAGVAPGLSGHGGIRRGRAGADLSRVQRARPDPARARRHARTHRVRGGLAPRRGHALLASRRPIPWRNAHFSPAVVGHRPRRAHTDRHR